MSVTHEHWRDLIAEARRQEAGRSYREACREYRQAMRQLLLRRGLTHAQVDDFLAELEQEVEEVRIYDEQTRRDEVAS